MKAALEKLRRRLEGIKIVLPTPEPWPPTEEGDLATVLYNQLKAEGVELPAERPDADVFLFLLSLEAPRIWADYRGEC